MDKKLRKRKFSTMDITLIGLFVALMMIGANITSFAPFMVINGVPITLQTFFAILAGAILGSRVGAVAMIVYMLLGLVGAPVFARFNGGFTAIISPTFGFIVSFIFTAYVTGKIVERKKTVSRFITAALIGMTINYVFGTNWLYAAFKLWAEAPPAYSYKVAWISMMVPLPKDIILSVFAGVMAHRLHHSVLSKYSLGKHAM
ncbi:biotin transport system substrate-specific component [Oikeobacillus pervagus]|uniref:Biotin transporter n=1 Tax=Oikeobacillus pervagus TaxID=1325931 RepID=A0AAJ1T2Z4_9BACI|nr:biotin transporter BioY [Oikeobacillus pervagus]MDQ0214326.1 biotin transport system substrate-specific component [Oikeobacillus pervagus]